LLKNKVGGNVSSTGERLACMLGICKITSINQEITILAECMVEEVMILVLEGVIVLLGEICICGMSFNEIVECLKALTRHLFLLARFVIGAVALADECHG
jgi:hypothetical protein